MHTSLQCENTQTDEHYAPQMQLLQGQMYAVGMTLAKASLCWRAEAFLKPGRACHALFDMPQPGVMNMLSQFRLSRYTAAIIKWQAVLVMT